MIELDGRVVTFHLTGVLAEQVHPYTGEPLSVSPWTWSHAGFVAVVHEDLEKRTSLQGQRVSC